MNFRDIFLSIITITSICWIPGLSQSSSSASLDPQVERALSFYSDGRSYEAIQIIKEISQANEQYALGHYYLGLMSQFQGDFEGAVPAYERFMAMDPNNPVVLNNLANCYTRLDRQQDLIEGLYLKALEADPLHDKAALNLGLWYWENGLLSKAETYYVRHIEVNPDDCEGYYNFAVLLQHQGKIELASAFYLTAIDCNPQYVDAWLNLATLHHRFGQLEDAIVNYRETIKYADHDDISRVAMLYNNMGLALYQLGTMDEAIECHNYVVARLRGEMDLLAKQKDYQGWLSLKDTEIHTWSHIYKANKAVCFWQSWETSIDDLVSMVKRYQLKEGKTSALLPFDTLGMAVSEEWRLSVAKRHATQWKDLASTLPNPEPELLAGQPMRVGYMCYDYNDHPTTHLVEGLFKWHRASQALNAIAYSYGKNDNSSYREVMQALAFEFVDIVHFGNAESIEKIRSDKIHIAVDMQGWTLGARVELVASRVAPIQVNYLIYPGTAGAPWIDYLIADVYVLPPENSRHFSEHIAYLPGSYQVNYYDRHFIDLEKFGYLSHEFSDGNKFSSAFYSERRRLRAENKLPESAFVFCNFNKNDKLEPEVFRIWMAVLRQVPSSVLWLLKPKEEAGGAMIRENLGAFAEASGIPKSRIIYAERVSKANHLYRQVAADLFIDTFVYGAHSTATDALRSGLPVLTLAGPSFPSRVGLSLILHSQKQTQETLITHSRKEFEQMAIRLATSNQDVLFRARLELFQDNSNSVLFDTALYTESLQRSYEAMWESYSSTKNKYYHLVIGNKLIHTA